MNNGTTNAPTCSSSFSGSTAETNNLDLTVGSCTPFNGASPAITFKEGGGGVVPPPGYSVGDTHLTTFFGVHYDFQASGDFVLAQADPGLVVQTRQIPSSNPRVSVNTAVATKMQDNSVAVCLTGCRLTGRPTPLADGASLSLTNGVIVSRKGSVYTVSRPSGDVVQADLSPGSYMNVSVTLGVTNKDNIRGLLGGESTEQHDPIDGHGEPLRSPFSYTKEFLRYADSWRVRPEDSLVLCSQSTKPEWPETPIYAGDIPQPERGIARGVCMQAGVKNETLLDDCTLDVSLLGNTAADVFRNVPAPARALRPTYP